MTKLFYIFDHQHKSKTYVEALERYGWQRTSQRNRAAFIMADLDHSSRKGYFDYFASQKKPVFLYPHAARPNIFHDYPGFDTYPNITAQFTSAFGHIEILRLIGDTYPIEFVGWHLCPMRDFQPKKQARKILFAPIHPNADGSLPVIDIAINAQSFRALLILHEVGEIDLTVRYIRDLPSNGLWPVDNVKYIQGNKDQSYKEIDEADLVVSSQTFAYISIARGVPTIMMAENVPPRIVNKDKKNFDYVKSFDKYKHLYQYPYDILSDIDTISLFNKAIRSDKDILDWKSRMIGQPFDAEYFVHRLESYL